MTHEFSQAPKDFPGLGDCHPQTNFNLFEMQIKPELRCGLEDGGEDVDMDYMMDMSFDCDNGNEAVCSIVCSSLAIISPPENDDSLLELLIRSLFTCKSHNIYLIST